MSGHTPGPWFMRTNRHRDTDGLMWGWVDSNDSGSQRPPAGANVCWTKGKTSYANACLIAAAPELLEELEDRYHDTKCGCGHPSCRRCQADKRTLKVINKPKGETE